jgi:hypothetical protein
MGEACLFYRRHINTSDCNRVPREVPTDHRSTDGGRGPSTSGIRSLTESPSLRMTRSWIRFSANAFTQGKSQRRSEANPAPEERPNLAQDEVLGRHSVRPRPRTALLQRQTKVHCNLGLEFDGFSGF